MKSNQSNEYFKFRFPKEAVDNILEYVDLNPDLYSSFIDFYIEAIRIRLEEIRSEMQEKEKMKKQDILARTNIIRERLNEIAHENAKQNAEEIKK